MSLIGKILPSRLKKLINRYKSHYEWQKDDFNTPLPADAKRAVLGRYGYPNATWIETGTYLGETTEFLAQFSSKVISLEPEPHLYNAAKIRLKSHPNIELINATSEQSFPEILPELIGPISFWLDGHYSGGNTFLGIHDTPLKFELDEISKKIKDDFNSPVAILIDDVRLCSPAAPENYKDYPSLDNLVDWARSHGMQWMIEHDIFIMRRKFENK